MAATELRAATISGFLRRAGFNPLGSGTSRAREGMRVRQSLRAVFVAIDLDGEREAARLADEVWEALTDVFVCVRESATLIRVAGTRPSAAVVVRVKGGTD